MGFFVSWLRFFLFCGFVFESRVLRLGAGFVLGRDSLDGLAEGGEGEDFEPVGVDDCEGGAEDVGEVIGERRGRRGGAGGGSAAADVGLHGEPDPIAPMQGEAVPDEFFAEIGIERGLIVAGGEVGVFGLGGDEIGEQVEA